MSQKRRSLGKGLTELLGSSLDLDLMVEEVPTIPVVVPAQTERTDLGATEDGIRFLPLSALEPGPFQPRKTLSEEGILSLAESIKTQGVLQPILVRPKMGEPGKYEIVAGERRYRASDLAGLEQAPCIVRPFSDHDALIVGLIENIQRENLNPMEEAQALQRILEENDLTHAQVSEMVGKSRTGVTNALRLLTLPEEVQTMLADGVIGAGHAKALLGLSEHLQIQVARTIKLRGLSVRETERIVARLQAGVDGERNVDRENTFVVRDPNITGLERDLADKLGAPVSIRHTHQGKGSVVIRYNDVNELEGILNHIR